MKVFFAVCIGLAFLSVKAQEYNVSIDLVNVKKDRITVTVKTPPVKEEIAEYIIPAVIPGSYSRKDFGRFVKGFKALDANGKKLKVKQEGENVFIIKDATRLSQITYQVDDTWDAKDDNYIFQPGGTNIDAGKSFMINHHGFIGYLENYKMLPYQVTINKPAELYGATALDARRTMTADVFSAEDYVSLVDNPIMYCRPDTISFKTGNTRVYTAVCSETGAVKARTISEMLQPLSVALDNFFDGMPVDQYHFLFYFPSADNEDITKSGGYGALEHSYSSVYFLPELYDTARLRSMVSSVAAHEFLHILTPLNIHSEEIEKFDFRNPKMSAHLWLYEGVTEYFSHLVQLRDGLISLEDFNEEMTSKIRTASNYPDVSFTEMSRNILDDQYKETYTNVYYKGALIAFLLDIRLNELTQGKMGLKDLMNQLAAKYGPEVPFKDDQLIDEIVSMTHPGIKDFFDAYVVGDKPLPYAEFFNKIGLAYHLNKKDSVVTYGNMSFGFDENELIVAGTPEGQNVFGLVNGDVILKINETVIDEDNFRTALKPLIEAENENVVLIVRRKDKKTYRISADPVKLPVERAHLVEEMTDPSQDSLKLREALIH